MMARAARAAATGCRHLLAGAGTAGLLLWGASAAAQGINVTPSTVPVPVQGVPYSVTFVGSDGVAPYQFLVSTGMLPAGLSLSAGGALTGTPTTAAAYSFTITVSDALGRELDLAGAGAVAGALAITPPPVLVPGTPYSGQIAVSGGTGPYTFATVSGSLPPGMSLSASGLLSGTPTTPGSYSMVIVVTDSSGLSSTLALNITVAGATQIPVDAPWALAIAALGLGWLGRRQIRRQRRLR